tara:strand:+ start:362 stop:775 length:414 start_codon:yes stop_codon:yes gene_type:complete
MFALFPSALWMKIGAALALCAVMYFLGWNHEHKKLVAYQAEVAAVGKAQEVINAAKVKEHETISTSIANQYEARLSAVHSYYAERLLDPSASSGGVSTVSKPAKCVNAAPANAVSARQCAETTLMLTELQNWVRSIK